MQLFVVGAGYVGLTTAVGLAAAGHDVTAHDVAAERVALLSSGRSPIFEPGLEAALQSGLASGRLRFTSEPAPARSTEVAIVCVPTPKLPDGTLDTSIVEGVVRGLRGTLRADATIAVRSTLPLHGPETLEAIVAEAPAGPPVVVNPEFMREGHALADFNAPSRVVVGHLGAADRPAAERFAGVYGWLAAPVLIADARSVVLIKLASNVFLGMKIAFADELARLADATGADVDVVADGIGLDPRIGRAFLTSGPGFGGSCLPEQAAAIAVEVDRRSLEAPLLSTIATSNARHMQAIVEAVGARLGSGLPGARVALLGLAFKANTDDVRESPALAIARALRDAGATVVAYDPVAEATATRADPQLVTAATAAEAADGADAVLVVTEWAEFGALDWPSLAGRMRGDLVYDARRIADPAAVRAAGLRYVPLGRAAAAVREPAPTS